MILPIARPPRQPPRPSPRLYCQQAL